MLERNSFRMTRRRFAMGSGALVTGALFAPSIVRAETRSIQVNGPAATAKVFKEHIFPEFEKQQNCTIVYEGGHSLDGLQKLRANKDSPVTSVAVMDSPVLIQAGEDGLLEAVDTNAVPNMANLFPGAINQDGLFLNYKWPRLSIAYYTKALQGVDSWKDLWDSQYAHKILIPTPKVTQFPVILAAAAYAETGKPLIEAQYDLDSAFKKLAELKPNLLDAFSSSASAATLIEQGEAVMGAGFFSSYVLFRTEAGAPIDLASPKEGSFALPNALAKIRNGPHPDLSNAFIDMMLSEKVQQILMTEFKDSPTNSKVELEPGIVSGNDLISLDWAFASKSLEENTKRFDREMAL